jgi:hypothetical protein
MYRPHYLDKKVVKIYHDFELYHTYSINASYKRKDNDEVVKKFNRRKQKKPSIRKRGSRLCP